MDKKAVKILLDSYWTYSTGRAHRPPNPDNFEYAKSKAVMFDPLIMDHNEIIEWMKKAAMAVSKEQIAKGFLSSLSSRQSYRRSALSSFAFARHFPAHTSLAEQRGGYCQVCGVYNSEKRAEDLNVLNFERMKWGGIRFDDPLYVAFDLHLHMTESPVEPTPTDIRIWNRLLSTIRSVNEWDRPNQLEKKLIGLFPSRNEERRAVIGILGITGILETARYPGYWETYIPPHQREERYYQKTDWPYPVEWWTGADGVNQKPLEFYFSNYLE